MIPITDLKTIETEYIQSKTTYSELSKKYGIPIHTIARYANKNGWSAKRKAYSLFSDSPALDISKLARSADALESIIEAALSSVSCDPPSNVDTKILKDLTSALKEAISIKQNIYLLPVLTEQKQLELETKKCPQSSESNEIRVTLENGTNQYCV